MNASARDQALFTLLATAWLWGKHGDGHTDLVEEEQTECFTAVKALMELHGESVEAVGAADENRMWVSSGYGALTKRPFVALTIEGRETQIRPEKARELAHMMYDSAAHAEMDAVLVRFLSERLEVTPDAAASIMVDEFRPMAEESRLRDLADHEPGEQPVAERLDDARGGVMPMNRKARRAAARAKGNRG